MLHKTRVQESEVRDERLKEKKKESCVLDIQNNRKELSFLIFKSIEKEKKKESEVGNEI